MAHLDDEHLTIASLLRERIDHLASGISTGKNAAAEAIDRVIREQAFTILNRLAALRMCEERGIVQECIRNGFKSGGFQVYCTTTGASLGDTFQRYQVFLQCLFDEISIDLWVLFDRFSPLGLLFPREQALQDALSALNDDELTAIWGEDETIGWIYQYFNSKEERDAMRKASNTPRSSRELAVRNQFFTPRYVVEFLGDNTLGRIWYEMRRGETRLIEKCRYLIRRPMEIFLGDPVKAYQRLFGAPDDGKIEVPELVAKAFRGDLSDLPEKIGPEAYWISLGIPPDQFEKYTGIQWQPFDSGPLDELLEHTDAPLNPKYAHDVTRLWMALSHFRLTDSGSPYGFKPFTTLWCAFREAVYRDQERLKNSTHQQVIQSPVYVPHRSKKDPRDLRILDPACGSGHFLLYAFDLLECIYEEAWEDMESPTSEATGRTLRQDFETLDSLRHAIPELIVRWNIHGIDIDPRTTQIAALSLWLRAQKLWKGLRFSERPKISKSNIVTAEAMPGEGDMRRDFIDGLTPRVLGQLVNVVFDKMKLAGEAGSLLKIEEEIHDAVAEAKMQWLQGSKPEQLLLFPDRASKQMKQLEMRFDLKGVTDDHFWEHAEERIFEALKYYAERAGNGHVVRCCLFADDAARGFAFIDLCRKRYDVILMNPPFGEFSKQWKEEARSVYPFCYNDILGAFVERFLNRLHPMGRLGTITSRTCFFLGSFTDWRLNVLSHRSAVEVIADLGQGVMDDAMVEAAAYVLQRSAPTHTVTVFRTIASENQQQALEECLDACRKGQAEPRVFHADQSDFNLLPDSPFVYWIDGETIRQFASSKHFEPDIGVARNGMTTGDDHRFVRTIWEVLPEDTQFCYYPAKGECFCRFDDPVVQAYFRRRSRGDPRWSFFVKAGASQPWYSPITLKINWANDGAELRNFQNEKGKPRAFLRSIDLYYRSGFSWTRRAVRFYPYVVPCNCIPSVSRYMAFPQQGKQVEALGLCASRLASAFLRFYGEKFEWPNFLVGNLKILPWPEISQTLHDHFESLIAQGVEQRRLAYQNQEPFYEFLLPAKVHDLSCGGLSLSFDPTSLIGEEGERLVAEAYGFTPKQSTAIERDLLEAIAYQKRDNVIGNGDEDNEEDSSTDFSLDTSSKALEEACLSYLIGCVFGRWDVRIALDPSLAPKLGDPFDPLPVCPPGMLIGPDGLPAQPGRIVSEEWLRARPKANILPPEGCVSRPIIDDAEYPMRITWNGILVHDSEIDETVVHQEDIVRRIREALELLWGDKAQAIEHEATKILGVSNFRGYFRKSSGFFEDHLKRYSKSRRKAPIYWPLSTESGLYTLWIYYHRLTDQTLFQCIIDYVNPKIESVAQDVEKLRGQVLQGGTAKQRDQLEKLQKLQQELVDFRDELLRVAQLPYRPNVNDGVLITASPLFKLFRLPKWRKDLEECWKKLQAGEYDWAHLAYSIWPERVRKACKTDKSIAIAHGLEELYEEPKVPKKTKRAKKGVY